jgi:hypothetical protein
MLRFVIDKKGDPDRTKLREVLEAQLTYERGRAARSWFVHLLAVVGVILWIESIWPDLLSPNIRFFSLVVFGGVLFITIRTAIEEIACRRRVQSCLKAQEGVTQGNVHESP